MMREADDALLSVRNLNTFFDTPQGTLKAVEDLSFDVHRGETFGIVGESGCGKSVACLSIVRLVASPPGRYAGGQILLEGRDILTMSDAEIHAVRGGEISFIFQEPMTALNPVYTVGNQLEEAILLHQSISRREGRELALEWLNRVRIPNPDRVLRSYPFTLSGGMRQRAMIAMAMACQPKLLIADEPTTALDVTIQAQILELINSMQRETGVACIFITHDLAVISEMADRVMVMYCGRVCETAPTAELLSNPLHPYTRGLIESRPRGKGDGGRLQAIPGNVPSLADKGEGCPFSSRCNRARAQCGASFPPAVEQGGEGHFVSCWNYSGGSNHG